MRKLSGPKLDLSQLKIPPIARDVYQDLRDRRLLPLVALVVVAILGVPFLLSGGGSDLAEEAPAPVAPEVAIETSKVEVVKAAPGLREPDKRLSGRRAKDPFQQHFTGAAVSTAGPVTESSATPSVSAGESGGSAAGAAITSPAPSPASAPSGVPSTGGGGGSSDPSGGSGPSAQGDAPKGIVLYSYAADIKIVKTETTKSGKKETGEPEERHRVLPSTVLPSPKQQVVTYMGISPKTRKPLLLISTDVTAIFGDAKCASGTDVCQLLEMEPTFPQTFVYGENGVRFKITVLDVNPVVVDKRGDS